MQHKLIVIPLTGRRLAAMRKSFVSGNGARVVYLLAPSNLLVLGVVFAAAVFVLRLRSGRIAIALSVGALAIAALAPLGNILLSPLERRFPEMMYPAREGLTGIIVLGGSYDAVRHAYLSNIVLENDTEPLALVVDLARRYPEAKIIVSGGTTFEHGVSEASIMKEYFASFGIDPRRIMTEDRSQTTAQHAQFTADLLHPSPSSQWLLLTYAHLMPRAIGTFRKAGFNISAFPVHLRTDVASQIWTPDNTGAENLRKLDIAAYEWLGLVYYKLKGHSDDWFPRPADSPNNGAPDLISEKPPARSLPSHPSAFREGKEEDGG